MNIIFLSPQPFLQEADSTVLKLCKCRQYGEKLIARSMLGILPRQDVMLQHCHRDALQLYTIFFRAKIGFMNLFFLRYLHLLIYVYSLKLCNPWDVKKSTSPCPSCHNGVTGEPTKQRTRCTTPKRYETGVNAAVSAFLTKTLVDSRALSCSVFFTLRCYAMILELFSRPQKAEQNQALGIWMLTLCCRLLNQKRPLAFCKKKIL